ncbi:MAG: S9 family peptidase [Promethearchaeota archaeon]
MDFSDFNDFKQYLAIETAGGATWHPNCRDIAFVYDNPGYFQIFTVAIQPQKTLLPTRITFEKDRCTDPYYLADGTLLFLKDNKGDENFQIGFLTRDQTGGWLTSDLKTKHLINLVTDNALYYAANIENKSVFGIYRHKISVQHNTSEILYQPEQGLFSVQLASPDEKFLVLSKTHGNNFQELYLLETETGHLKELSRQISGETEARWVAVQWLDNNHLLALSDYRSDFLRFVIISFDGQFTVIDELETDLKFEIDYQSSATKCAFRKNSPYTYFAYNQDGYSTLSRAIFSTQGCSDYETLALPPEAVIVSADSRTFKQGLSLSPDGNMLALTLSSPTTPINIWIIDLQSRNFWKATDVNIASLNPDKFRNCSLERFSTFDKMLIPYFRYLPSGEKPDTGWPTILVIHGGPEAQIRPNFSPVIQFFLSTGFAVITPNIRGSTGYGRKYLNLDNCERRLDAVRDIKYLVKHIQKNNASLDPNRLVIFGGSYGGFAVLSAMTEYPDLWKAGVDIFGIADFVTFLQNTASWRRKHRETEYGSLDNDMETLIRISPIHRVDQITAPLFIIAGDNDERVPVSESIQMYESLQERGLSVKLLRFADEGHGITKLKNKITAYSEIVTWLKKHV